MSAKVSTASSASAGASVTGPKAAPAAGSAPAAGNGASDGVSAAAAPRGSSSAGAGTGSTSGSSAFSSALTDAVQAGDQAAIGQVQEGKRSIAGGTADVSDSIDNASGVNITNGTNITKAGTDERTCSIPASDVTGGPGAAVNASAPDNRANALPTVDEKADSHTTAPGQMGNARGGRAAVKSGAGRAPGRDDASAVATDPVALTMLLAASGMQVSSGADVSSADGTSSTPSHAVDGSEPAIAATGAAANFTAGVPAAGSTVALGAANALAVSASAQHAPPARDAPPAAPDAASLAITAGTGFPGASEPLQGRTGNSDPPAGQQAIMVGSAGLPDLVRSFAYTSAQTPVVEATISVPVAGDGWPHAVAAQVHWFVNNDVQSATLRLSPEHLGPVEVHIDVRHSQVNVNFSAAHAETRVALEQTVPRLREIFASGGLTLGQANVQQDPHPGTQPSVLPVRAAFGHAQTVESAAVAAAHALGLVDEYA